jgi:AAA family ATP:ADP antiporter
MIQIFKQLSHFQKKFIAICMAFSFLITLDYSCLRPAAHALFITHFGSKALPWVWLMSLPINFLIVAFFNKNQAKWGSRRLSLFFPLVVMGINFSLSFAMSKHAGFCFIFYIWKDLYILLMFQQLWSQIHASLGHSVGRYFYGAMYALGAMGSLLGATVTASLKLPATSYLYCTVLIYPLIFVCQKLLLNNPEHVPFEKKAVPKAIEGIKQIIGNYELITIGLLVALMQMVSALSEFNFSKNLEVTFTDLASRTQASASIMSYMHALTLGLQLILAWVSIDKLGVKRGHQWVPLALGFTSLGYLFNPSFLTASINYIGCKSLDFSVFSLLKESLYAPLDTAYKYEAKSFIDIFVYRGAKTLMSISLIAFGVFHSHLFFGLLLSLLVGVWFFIAKTRLNRPQSQPQI